MQFSKEKELQIQQAMELEREVMATLQRVKAYETSIYSLKKNIQKCNITLKELAGVQDQRTFAPVGRCFIMKSKNDIINDMTEVIKSHEKDIDEYEKMRTHLITKGKEVETQLHEAMRALKV